MDPLVSVVVATYRRDDGLSKALKSLANQTYRNYEIVVVDDNDNLQWNMEVRRILDIFSKENQEIAIRYIANHPNQGSAKARNEGIMAADGEYITFLDDDDLYLPAKIQRQVTFMQASGCEYCITDLDLYSENDKLIDKRVRSYIRENTQEALQRYHLMYHLTGTDTMMFKKEYLLKIGCFAPIDVGDEYYLMQRAIDGGGKFGYLSGCDVKAYVHTGDTGMSSGDGKIKGENLLFAYKKKSFDRIDEKDRRYITMRHYAVIAFAKMRQRKYAGFVQNAMLSFLHAPVQCLCLLRQMIRI